MKATPTKIVIRKDGFTPTYPWYADLHWSDQTVWKSWQGGFRTKKRMLDNIAATSGADLPQERVA